VPLIAHSVCRLPLMPIHSIASKLTHAIRRRRGFSLAALSGLVSLLGAAGFNQLAQKERELVFRIAPGIASWYDGLPDGVVESMLSVANEGKTEHIHTWWWPAKRNNAPALLYLHGARWNLTGHLFRIEQLRKFGFSVLAIDYRGFGQSDGGLPSESTVYEDAQIAWQHLAKLQPDPAKRFIYGHSLGGAVAIDLAARLQQVPSAAGGLIVESSFTSLADMARSFSYPWLPLQLLISQKFDSVGKIAQVGMPVLIVHGLDDRYVTPRFSEKLYAAATGHKRLLLVEGGNHNDSMLVGSSAYRQAFSELFGWAPQRRLLPG
jgi:uncharacterized protein